MQKKIFSSFPSLFDAFKDKYGEGAVFVFPSELIRRFFLEKMADRFSAVDAGRFFSWDDFLRLYASSPLMRSAGAQDRLFFASRVAALCKKGEKLEGLFYDGIEDSSPFINYIASLLPDSLVGPVVLDDFDKLPAKRAEAIRRLGDLYRDFLNEAMLFEPESLFLDARSRGRLPEDVVVVYPSLFTIRAFYADLLPESWVGLDLQKLGLNLSVFPDPVSEVRFALDYIVRKLDEGCSLSDFSIVLADKNLEGILKTEASVLGLPLSMEFSKPLRSLSGVRFVFLLNDLVASDFSFEAVRDLFLANDVPWRFTGTMRELVRIAVDKSYFFKGKGEGRLYVKERVKKELGDDFFDKLKNLLDSDDYDAKFLFDQFYASYDGDKRDCAELGLVSYAFFSFLQSIVECNNFYELLKKFDRFCSLLLKGDFDMESRRAQGFVKNVLKGLCRYERFIKDEFCKTRPWDIWLNVLSGISYVSSEEKKGISVYPYRLTAGIDKGHVFLLGLDAESASVRMSLFSFLPEIEKDAASIKEYELGDAFLCAYSACNASFSMHMEGAGRQHEPPPYVLINGRLNYVEQAELEGLALYEEKSLFEGKAKDFLPFSSQKTGYESALHMDSYFFRGNVQLDKKFFTERMKKKNYIKDDLFVISPHFVQSVYDCPFRMFVSRLVGLDEYRIRPVFYDNMIVGRALHSAIAGYFKDKKGLSSISSCDFDFRSFLASCFKKNGSSDFSDILAERYAAHLATLPQRLSDALKMIDEEEFFVEGVESELSFENNSDNFVLNGRADLLLKTKTGATVVIDFKTKNVPVFPYLEKLNNNESLDLQVLLYMLILYHNNNDDASSVADGIYFPIVEDGNKKHLGIRKVTRNKAYADDEHFKSAMRRLDKFVADIVEVLDGFKFSYASDPGNVCSSFNGSCAYRRLCRARFAIKEVRYEE